LDVAHAFLQAVVKSNEQDKPASAVQYVKMKFVERVKSADSSLDQLFVSFEDEREIPSIGAESTIPRRPSSRKNIAKNIQTIP
jgi:hypothetical protein